MIDADVQTAIKLVLDTLLPSAGVSNALVARSYNPSVQGPPTQPVIVFSKLAPRRYGWQGQKYLLTNPVAPLTFDKDEVFYVRDTYQLSGLMTEDVPNPARLNASDVLGFCATLLQSLEGRAIFKAASIGLDRITDIRTPQSLGDSDRFQMDASFDFVLSYKNTLTSQVPGALVSGSVTSV